MFNFNCKNIMKKFIIFFYRFHYISIISLPIVLFIILYLVTGYNPILGVIAALIGTIFPALKYRLDGFHYNLELFSKRFEFFEDLQKLVNEIHKNYNGRKIGHDFLTEFDNMFNEAQFYFNDQTVDFLEQFRSNMVSLYLNEELSENDRERIDSFFGYVISNLKKEFPELQLSLF